MYRHTFPYIELTLKYVLVMVDITIHIYILTFIQQNML